MCHLWVGLSEMCYSTIIDLCEKKKKNAPIRLENAFLFCVQNASDDVAQTCST